MSKKKGCFLKKKAKAVPPADNGPDFGDGTDAEGFPDGDERFILVPEPEDFSSEIVVQDFDPLTPDAELAEPQKILKPHDRIARKRERGSRE